MTSFVEELHLYNFDPKLHYALFQDGPLRIEASTTGALSTISKIIRMVSI